MKERTLVKSGPSALFQRRAVRRERAGTGNARRAQGREAVLTGWGEIVRGPMTVNEMTGEEALLTRRAAATISRRRD